MHCCQASMLISYLIELQHINMYTHTYTQDLVEQLLTKEQKELIGKGNAGPPVSLDGIALTDSQVLLYPVIMCLSNDLI